MVAYLKQRYLMVGGQELNKLTLAKKSFAEIENI